MTMPMPKPFETCLTPFSLGETRLIAVKVNQVPWVVQVTLLGEEVEMDETLSWRILTHMIAMTQAYIDGKEILQCRFDDFTLQLMSRSWPLWNKYTFLDHGQESADGLDENSIPQNSNNAGVPVNVCREKLIFTLDFQSSSTKKRKLELDSVEVPLTDAVQQQASPVTESSESFYEDGPFKEFVSSSSLIEPNENTSNKIPLHVTRVQYAMNVNPSVTTLLDHEENVFLESEDDESEEDDESFVVEEENSESEEESEETEELEVEEVDDLLNDIEENDFDEANVEDEGEELDEENDENLEEKWTHSDDEEELKLEENLIEEVDSDTESLQAPENSPTRSLSALTTPMVSRFRQWVRSLFTPTPQK